MLLNTCLIDDDSLFREHLELELKKFSQVNIIGSYASVFDALALLNNETVHLLFLDIDMPDVNGLAFKRQLKANIPTVFVTSHREYALEGFEVNAFDFIVKPADSARLLNTIQRALTYYQPNATSANDDYVYINSDNQYIKVFLKDIIAAEADENYTKIHTVEKSFLALMRLRRLEEQLPSHLFMRVHRSFLINSSHIKQLDNNSLLMTNDIQVPISPNLKEQLIKQTVEQKLLKR